MDFISFMFLPFLACLLLVGINVYFGIHVLKREIIFIDIALAQIAALGGTIAVVIEHLTESGLDQAGHDHSHEGESIVAYLISIGVTILAAAAFTYLKSKKLRIPLEALIGIAYAVAATGSVILLDKAAGGDVHVSEMMSGSILWVNWEQIGILALVVGLVGVFHYLFRNKFLSLTDNYHENGGKNGYSKLWDFLFYASFGVVVVHSVEIGGILTVFAFLIIPAAISALFSNSWSVRIALGLGLGTIVSICGLYLSKVLDVPGGPTVILCLGGALVISLVIKALKLFESKSR